MGLVRFLDYVMEAQSTQYFRHPDSTEKNLLEHLIQWHALNGGEFIRSNSISGSLIHDS